MEKSIEQYKEELLSRTSPVLTWDILCSEINVCMAVEFPGIEYSVEFIKENQEIKMYVRDGYSEIVRQYLIEIIIPITLLLTVKDI